MDQNCYMEPRSSRGSASQSPTTNYPPSQAMHSPDDVFSEQQINGGFVQSPILNKPAMGHSELETSFSDDLSISPGRGVGGQLPMNVPYNSQSNNNGSMGGLPTMSPNQSMQSPGLSPTSPQQTLPNPYTNDTVQIPIQYYQHLHQLSMMYPALHANQNEASIATPMSQQAFGTMPNNPTTNHEHDKTTAFTDSTFPVRRPKLPNPRIPNRPSGRQEVANSQIYDEIPAHKMYADLPKLPGFPANQESTIRDCSDSLLPHGSPALHQKNNNPLYGDTQMLVDSDTGSPSTQRDSSSTKSLGSGTRPRRRCGGYRCMCICILLLTVVSCTALAITLLTASRIITFHNDTDASLSSKADTGAVKSDTDATAAISGNMSASLNYNKEQIEELQTQIQQLHETIQSMSGAQLTQQQAIQNLTNIIPTGGINPKLCVYDTASSTRGPGSTYNLQTAYVPNYDSGVHSMDQILIAASCSSMNFLDFKLEKEKYGNTDDIFQYRCSCYNYREEREKGISCTIYYWMCPVIGS